MTTEDIEQIITVLKQRFILIERNGSFDTADKEKQTELITTITNITGGVFGVDPAVYKTKYRGQGIPLHRGLICKAVREISEKRVSLDFIGKYFNSDHSSMIHVSKRAEDLISTEKFTAHDYQIILNTYNKS